MMRKLAAIARDDAGTAALDYALIAALMVIGLVAVLGQIGENVGNSFNTTATEFSGSQ